MPGLIGGRYATGFCLFKGVWRATVVKRFFGELVRTNPGGSTKKILTLGFRGSWAAAWGEPQRQTKQV